MTTVWVTDKALTDGIVAVEGEHCTQAKDGFFVQGQLACDNRIYYPPDWHPTRQQAVLQARLMRVERIASLEGQLVMLRAMAFEAEE